MDAIRLLLLSILIYFGGALFALFFGGSGSAARRTGGLIGLLASLAGIAAAAVGFTGPAPAPLRFFQAQPFGYLALEMDSLSAFMVGLIALIGAGTSIYAIQSRQNNRVNEFFTQIFLASMMLVVTVSNAFYFLLFWELMTLVSYFLVIWQSEKPDSIRTGYIYMLVAHAGAALIMLAFFLLFQRTGSFDFAVFREAALPAGFKSLIFLLTFVGFGAKAGMVPLHFWTPGAYAAAPGHVSALMAGVMKKTAVYGILRVSVDLLGVQEWWWGVLVLAFGALSTVIGAFYALSEKDLKRLLAYSSVENVGIIFLGVGAGMVGIAVQQPLLAVLGFLAALYHTLNHAFFKSLLFLGAGAAIEQLGTNNLNQMGGLSRRMPWTALTFFTGALAVSAIPPFNGFVSEWLTYQTLYNASKIPLFAVRVSAPLFGVALALAGAFAVMVYIKAYGSAFAGPARSPEASGASEAPAAPLFSLGYLALGCLALGLGSPWIAPRIAAVAANLVKTPPVSVSNGWQLFPGDPAVAVVSPPLVALLILGLLSVPWLMLALFGGLRSSRRTNVEPWSCGYGYKAPMSLNASGFDQPVKLSFRFLYQLRHLADRPAARLDAASEPTLGWITRVEPVVESVVTKPAMRLVETAGQWIQALQMGDIRVYCLYIIITLAVLLILIFGRSGL